MNLHRIVELQAKTVTRKTTDTQRAYDFIENLVESTKPKLPKSNHDYLISTPFRYSLPVPEFYQARFKPPFYPRNAFYGAQHFRTSCFEVGYHWLRQRVHLKGLSQSVELRTHFQVFFKDSQLLDLVDYAHLQVLMNRHSYLASHQFVLEHPNVSSIRYPSCRDPEHEPCVITFEINTLSLKSKKLRTLHFIYLTDEKICRIENPIDQHGAINVAWQEVS